MGGRYHIATAQMAVKRNAAENLPRILESIAAAGAAGAHFLLLPECALSGYHGEFDQAEVEGGLDAIAQACASTGVVTLVGTGFRDGQSTYNQVRILDQAGGYIGAHSKTIPTFGDREWCVAGGGAQVFEVLGLRLGTLICNDLWCTPPSPVDDPHLVQALEALGAQLIFHAVSSGFEQSYLKWHTAHLETYARLFDVTIVTANAGGDEPNNCPTGILDASGEWIAQLDRVGEGLLFGTIEIAEA